MEKGKIIHRKKKDFVMSRKAGLFYSALLIGSAVFIHLQVNGSVKLSMEFIYIIIGLLIGSGIILILQLFLKKI